MTQDELSGMANKNCILFIRGLDPFFCTKYDLKKHPNYKLSGDAKDEFKYDVKKMLHTGRNEQEIPQRRESIRLYDEAQIADTRISEREHRHHTRPPRERTAGGKTCLQVEPFDLVPHLGIPPEELTEQQLREQREAAQENQLEYIHVPDEEAKRAEYERELQRQLMSEFYGTDDERMEEHLYDEEQ